MKITWPLLLIAAAAACAHGPVAPGDDVRLEEHEGLLALVIQSDAPVDYLQLGNDDDSLSLATPWLAQGESLTLFKAPAGKYCVFEIRLGAAQYFGMRSPCYAVKPGQTTYSGHLVLQARKHEFGPPNPKKLSQPMHGIDVQIERATALLDATYPGLSKKYPLVARAPLP